MRFLLDHDVPDDIVFTLAALERAALVGLLDKAGESGIRRNFNFA